MCLGFPALSFGEELRFAKQKDTGVTAPPSPLRVRSR